MELDAFTSRLGHGQGRVATVDGEVRFVLGDAEAVSVNLSTMPVDRCAASRGLVALERAGLVHVERRPGRKTLVTLPVSVKGVVAFC